MNLTNVYCHWKMELIEQPLGQKLSYRHATRGAGGGSGSEASSALFENQKKCPDFRETGSDFVHLHVKFTIQNVVLRVSKRKNFKIFPVGPFFLEFLTKYLSKCPNFTKPTLTWKISGCTSVTTSKMQKFWKKVHKN